MTTMPLLRAGSGVAVLTPAGVLPISTILGIGRNYAEHAKEQGAAVPDSPMVFSKNAASAGLSGETIVIPPVCREARYGGDQVDFEGELCVIIGPGPSGTGPRDVGLGDAMSYVLGYCVGNDVSARWWQKSGSGGQFFRGKSFDTFTPLGPHVVPASAVKDPQALKLETKVNGVVMQSGHTGDMLFSVAALIADLSRGMTLTPGTAILTGTPSGVGMARTPPVWLKDGDVVEITIESIGTLVSRVRNG